MEHTLALLRERGITLAPYQETGARWLFAREQGGVLADDMGCGKTLQALTAAMAFLHEHPDKVVIVAVNSQGVMDEWSTQAKQFFGLTDQECFRYAGSKRFEKAIPVEAKFILVTHATLRYDFQVHSPFFSDGRKCHDNCFGRGLQPHQLNVLGPQQQKRMRRLTAQRKRAGQNGARSLLYNNQCRDSVLIIDEADELRVDDRPVEDPQRVKKLSWLAAWCLGARHIYLLTGTPINNTEHGFISLLYLCSQGRVSHGTFRGVETTQEWCLRRSVEMVKAQNEQLGRKLPTQRTREIGVIPYEWEEEQLRAIEQDMRTSIDAYIKHSTQELSRHILMKMLEYRQIATHHCLGTPGADVADFDTHPLTKKEETIVILTQRLLQLGPIIIGTSFVRSVERVQAMLANANISSCTYHGDMSATQRRQSIADFNANKFSVMVMTVQAGGKGLNLGHACARVSICPEYNPAISAQADARVRRLNSKYDNVYLVDIYNHFTIEMFIRQKYVTDKVKMAREIFQDPTMYTHVAETKGVNNASHFASISHFLFDLDRQRAEHRRKTQSSSHDSSVGNKPQPPEHSFL
jgi:hypothetical protein